MGQVEVIMVNEFKNHFKRVSYEMYEEDLSMSDEVIRRAMNRRNKKK